MELKTHNRQKTRKTQRDVKLIYQKIGRKCRLR